MPVTATTSGRIAIIGAGSVGTACAYSLLINSLVRELVLINQSAEKAEGEAMDLQHAVPLGMPVRVIAGTYEEAAQSDIVILTAGGAGKPGGSRLELLDESRKITLECIGALKAEGFTGILVIATNPVDLITHIAQRASGLPPNKVIGSGTVIDTARLRAFLARDLGVDARSVHAFVIGEHGDSSVIVWSSAHIAGIPLASYPGADRLPSHPDLERQVREAGSAVATRKGNTSFAIASSITAICEAVLRDEHTVLPVSTVLEGQYGLTDICLGTPCIVGASGVEQILELPLDAGEREGLEHSAHVLREAAGAS